MKKILGITMLLGLLICVNAVGQETKADSYKPTPEINKFGGIWRSKVGTSIITIELKAYQKAFVKDLQGYRDVVVGSVVYMKDDKMVYTNENAIKNGVSGPGIPFELWATFSDPGGRSGRLFFTFTDHNNFDTLSLKVVPRSYLPKYKVGELKIPKNILLVRVK